MKTIGIDIRILAQDRRTGVEDYTINLLSRMLADKTNKYRLFYNGFRKLKPDYSWFNVKHVKIKNWRVPNRIFDLFLKFLKFPKIDKILGLPAGKAGVDIFLSPHFLITPLSKKAKRIMIFYDLSFLRFPDFFSFSKRFWHKFIAPKKQAQKADLIIAISESTKQDLIDLYKIEANKIKVIYPGVDGKFRPTDKTNPRLLEVAQKYALPDKFILYFGTIEPRKNILGIIRAFEEIKKSKENKTLDINWQGFEGVVRGREANGLHFSDIKLVIAGARGWLFNEIFDAVKNSEFKNDIIFTGFVDEEDKPYLYNLAQIFVYPSFFEGFGLPPLEAMACGVPTIVSNKSSLPEVVGDGAIMVNPENLDEIKFAIKEILANPDLSEQIRNQGLKRAQNFNWNNTANKFLELYAHWN